MAHLRPAQLWLGGCRGGRRAIRLQLVWGLLVRLAIGLLLVLLLAWVLCVRLHCAGVRRGARCGRWCWRSRCQRRRRGAGSRCWRGAPEGLVNLLFGEPFSLEEGALGRLGAGAHLRRACGRGHARAASAMWRAPPTMPAAPRSSTVYNMEFHMCVAHVVRHNAPSRAQEKTLQKQFGPRAARAERGAARQRPPSYL